MNLGKVKTFLIVLFLGINIYLVISTFLSIRFFIDGKTIDNTVGILEENSIKIDRDTILRSTVNLKNTDTNNIVYTGKFKEANTKKLFEIENDNFACTKYSENIHKKNYTKIKKEVKSFLEDSGFETKHMKFGSISTNSDGDKVFSITCYVKGYQIFDSKIKVTVSKDSFALKGTWYEPLSDNIKSHSRSRNTVYITSILVNMVHNENIMKNAPFEITDIDYGYLAGTSYGEGAHVTTSALPYYKIKDNKGNVYYYDAKNGSYLK